MELMLKTAFLLPVIASILLFLYKLTPWQKKINDDSLLSKSITYFAISLIFTSSIMSWIVVIQDHISIKIYNDFFPIFNWFSINDYHIQFGVSSSHKSILMLCLISTVSSLVHLYSMSYMSEEKEKIRFISSLSFFTFAMMALVLANNFVQLFFGWEGVGFASYLLINYYYKKKEANFASIIAFLMNRFSDIFMVSAIAILFYHFKSLDFNAVLTTENATLIKNIPLMFNLTTLDAVCLFLFIGAMGKSAQFFLHNWLSHAMQGPTPVSSLMHAATMVTAGVYLIITCQNFFCLSEFSSSFILIIGLCTSFFMSFIAMFQSDIKKIIAYSTCGQLGMMFVTCGATSYSVAFFHLVTHGFFKALLFLCAGCIIIKTHHNQNIFEMPKNLFKKHPFIFFATLIGTLSICGIPPFSGFFSKDAISQSLHLKHLPLYNSSAIIIKIISFFTAFYSFKLLFLTFFNDGKNYDNHSHHEHVMEKNTSTKYIISLSILIIFSIFLGYIIHENPLIITNSSYQDFTQFTDIMKNQRLSMIPIYTTLSSAILAWTMFQSRKFSKANLSDKKSARKIINFFHNGMMFDKLYTKVFIHPYYSISKILSNSVDFKVINKIIVEHPSSAIKLLFERTKTISSGNISLYSTISFAALIIIAIFAAI
jgi:NADH-quinone oxidoreductase subunit L